MTPAQFGAELERDLSRYHATLADWLVIRQHPESMGMKVISKGAPDFFGVCPARALCVLFDAKRTGGAAWPVGVDRGVAKYQGLEPHQFAALRRMNDVGGQAGVYLRTSEGDAWLPFAVVAPRWLRWWETRKVETMGIGDGVAVIGCDWVSVL